MFLRETNKILPYLKIKRLPFILIFLFGVLIQAASAQISILPEDLGWQELNTGWRSFGNFIPASTRTLSDSEVFSLDSNMYYVRGTYRFHPLASAGGGLAWNGQHGSLNAFGRWYFYANETPFFGLRPYTESHLDLMIGAYDDVSVFSQVLGLELQVTLFKFQAGLGPGLVFGAHPQSFPVILNSYFMLGVGF